MKSTMTQNEANMVMARYLQVIEGKGFDPEMVKASLAAIQALVIEEAK